MGISTSIIVQDPITTKDACEVFTLCRDTIGADRRHRWHETSSEVMRGAREYSMFQDQGLPAWLRVFYTTRGTLPVLDREEPTPDRTLEIWLIGGTDHASAHQQIRDTIGTWLSKKRFTWQWSDDYGTRRTWHKGS